MEIGRPGVLFWIRLSVSPCLIAYADLGYTNCIYHHAEKNSSMSLRFMPSIGYQSIFLCSESVQPDDYFDFDLFQKHVALAQTYHG